MNIPDPTEILENQIENQINSIDEAGRCSCYKCGKKEYMESMLPMTPHPASPLICRGCAKVVE